jgi:hypothetical protein
MTVRVRAPTNVFDTALFSFLTLLSVRLFSLSDKAISGGDENEWSYLRDGRTFHDVNGVARHESEMRVVTEQFDSGVMRICLDEGVGDSVVFEFVDSLV